MTFLLHLSVVSKALRSLDNQPDIRLPELFHGHYGRVGACEALSPRWFFAHTTKLEDFTHFCQSWIVSNHVMFLWTNHSFLLTNMNQYRFNNSPKQFNKNLIHIFHNGLPTSVFFFILVPVHQWTTSVNNISEQHQWTTSVLITVTVDGFKFHGGKIGWRSRST